MASHTFKISSGQSFEIQSLTAEVVAKENLKSFDFSQSGGGGYVGQHGGYVKPPQIHVQENNTDRIWLRDNAGGESPCDITNIDLPFREGHFLRQDFLHSPTGRQGRLVGITNQTSNKFVALPHQGFPLVDQLRGWKYPISAKICWLAFLCFCAAAVYLHFYVYPEIQQAKDLKFNQCLMATDPAPMKTAGMTNAQYRALLAAHANETAQKRSACERHFDQIERLEQDSNVDSHSELVASVRELEKKGYPDLSILLPLAGMVALILGFFVTVFSRNVYGDRLTSETAANIRSFIRNGQTGTARS